MRRPKYLGHHEKSKNFKVEPSLSLVGNNFHICSNFLIQIANFDSKQSVQTQSINSMNVISSFSIHMRASYAFHSVSLGLAIFIKRIILLPPDWFELIEVRSFVIFDIHILICGIYIQYFDSLKISFCAKLTVSLCTSLRLLANENRFLF